MFAKRCVLSFTLISCVAGMINVDYFNKNEIKSKLEDLEVNMNQTFYKLESKILDRLITYINSKTEALNKKIPELEGKISQVLNASNNEIEVNLVGKITQILNATNKQMEENLERKITQRLDASNQNILDMEKKMTQTLITSNKKIEDNLEEKVTQAFNALDSMKKELLEKNTIILNHLPCREVFVSRNRNTQYFSVDDDTLNHVSLKRNSTGHLTYFMMHVTIEAEGYVAIHLSDKESNSGTRYEIDIGQESDKYTALDIYSHGSSTSDIIHRYTPNIVSSSTPLRVFFKIDDGNLEFGKEGDSRTLISYNDARFSDINYFRFHAGAAGSANFRYDCPAPFKGSS